MRPGQRPVAEGTRLTITEQLELFQRSDDTGGAGEAPVGAQCAAAAAAAAVAAAVVAGR